MGRLIPPVDRRGFGEMGEAFYEMKIKIKNVRKATYLLREILLDKNHQARA